MHGCRVSRSGHPVELVERARILMEEDGKTLTETAETLGLATTVVHSWAKKFNWKKTEVLRRVHIKEQHIILNPTLESALRRLRSATKAEREAEFDEELHILACSIPLIVRSLEPHDVLSKADKVVRLVDCARSILGRDGSKMQPRSPLSIQLFSTARQTEKPAQVLQLPDSEELAADL